MHRIVAVLLVAALSACSSGTQAPPPSGPVRPTVAGTSGPVFADYASGRQAFTRRGGSLTAVLEDASWLRFEGAPADVETAHRAYFLYGYTTFQVELRSDDFTQPTSETFMLEDSEGHRLTGRPIQYQGATELVDDKWFSTFTLSFQHTLTSGIAWIRLTRQRDGSNVEWNFRPGAGPTPTTAR